MTPSFELPARDIAIACMMLGTLTLVFVRPWLGVLALAFLSFLQPHGFATGPLRHAPLVLIVFGVTVAAATFTFLFRGWRPPWPHLRDWRIVWLLALFGWFVVTTLKAINPWAAEPYLRDLLKVIPALLLVVLLIDTQAKLNCLLAIITASIGLVVLKGGVWAVMTGFHDRVYGPPGSPFGDNNEFAVVMTMTLPLMFWWLGRFKERGLQLAVFALIALTYAAILSTWSRGGLLALATVTILTVATRVRSMGLLAGIIAVFGLMLLALPADWFERMNTLTSFRTEESASSRLAAWRLGLEFAAAHPVLGGGFKGWIYTTLPLGRSMAWHSAYVQVLTEHGYVGLIAWVGLLVTTIGAGFFGPRRKPANPRAHSVGFDSRPALATGLAGYAVGAAFLSIAYWEIVFWFIVLAALASRLHRVSPETSV